MNISKLTLNQTFKNYKEMCSILEMPVKTGNGKRAQINELSRFCVLTNQGQKITVAEIFEEPLEKIDNRGTGNNRKEFPNFLVSKGDEGKTGVYKITLNNDMYIGSTTTSFRRRFIQHRKYNSRSPLTSDMLKNNAVFDILEICEGLTEPQIRELENQYIEEYKKNSNWNVVNTNYAWSHAPSNKPKKQKYPRKIPKQKVFKQKYRNIKFKVKAEDYNKTMILLKELNLIIQ